MSLYYDSHATLTLRPVCVCVCVCVCYNNYDLSVLFSEIFFVVCVLNYCHYVTE